MPGLRAASSSFISSHLSVLCLFLCHYPCTCTQRMWAALATRSFPAADRQPLHALASTGHLPGESCLPDHTLSWLMLAHPISGQSRFQKPMGLRRAPLLGPFHPGPCLHHSSDQSGVFILLSLSCLDCSGNTWLIFHPSPSRSWQTAGAQ